MFTVSGRRPSSHRPVPTFPQVVDLVVTPDRARRPNHPQVVRTAAAVVGVAEVVVSIALLSTALTTPSLASLLTVPVTAVLVVLGSYCAVAGVPAAQWRRTLSVLDGILVLFFWSSGVLAVFFGVFGAWTLAAVVPGGPQRFWFGDEAPSAPTTVAISTLLAFMSLAMVFTTAQSRAPEYSGVVSFRRGSVLFPVLVTSLVAVAYGAAAIFVAAEAGLGTTAVFATVVLAGATALVRSLWSTHRRVSEAKAELLETVDALLLALAGGEDRVIDERGLAFNRAYSRTTALRHPMLPQPMRVALDLVLSRAVDVRLWDVGSLEHASGGALRHLTRDDCRRLLADGASLVRSALRTTH
ncbi:hypothetical protein [Curtobacterium sp. ER1/6]|uniref:hypothetical protein n=1 Tax=Curtobacterium sp. ER1/6 TaxID=1891920 RepID=UPI00086ABEBD|nr:hypothetical protein [Curtobacterium sp. ER1/6]OEI68380.1 hypothetical protein Cus16_2051 [Curtobacterium sp. ER1/6]